MAIFPKIQSPCPYKSELASLMQGDTCRMCKRVVHDLNGMDDGERVAFLNSCAGEVCVSYSFPMKPAIAAAALALAAMSPLAAAAQDAPAQDMTEVEVDIIVGGIKDMANIEYVQDPADAAIPVLPVVYEDDAPAPAVAGAVTPATPASVTAPAAS